MRLLPLAIALALVGGCVAALHPGRGARSAERGEPSPVIDAAHATYWIWWSDGYWHLRTTSGGHTHRFQGSISGMSGAVTDLTLLGATSAERAALVDRAVQFDFESAESEGFDARVEGGCARFDLYFDGKQRPDRVRLGSPHHPPPHVPFDRCPPAG